MKDIDHDHGQEARHIARSLGVAVIGEVVPHQTHAHIQT